jgi:alkanesulfonate monooxygenase SsuD/methylene tetrahydromethanopterin reductase-like flavin-dependent oxidoreductase (luciferase family)
VNYGMTLPSMVHHYDRRTTLQWCARIDEGPYQSVSVGERVTFHNQEQTVLLAAAAALTKRVRIIATITILPMHPTALVAKRTATLDVLCDGRFVLGVGVGGREDDYASAEASFSRRHQRLDEKVAELRRMWRGEPPFPGAEPVGPSPVQPGGPPIFSSSFGPASLARSARWADGYAGFTLAAELTEMRSVADGVRQAWKDAGRAEAPYLMTSFWFSLGPDAQARHEAYVNDYLRYDPAMAEVMREGATITSPEAVRAAVAAAGEAGFDEVMFVPTTADLSELDRLEALL